MTNLNYTTLRDLLIPIGETTYETIYWTERDYILIGIAVVVLVWVSAVISIEYYVGKYRNADCSDEDDLDDQDDQSNIPTEPNSPEPSPDYDQGSPLDTSDLPLDTSDLPLDDSSTITNPVVSSSSVNPNWVARSYCNTSRFDWSKLNRTPRPQERVRSINVSLANDYTVDEYPIGYMRLDDKTRAVHPIRRRSH